MQITRKNTFLTIFNFNILCQTFAFTKKGLKLMVAYGIQ